MLRLEQYTGITEEWILTNPNFTAHPFHIHVYPFQVKYVKSKLNKVYPDVVETPAEKENFKSLTSDTYKDDGDTYSHWRDTIIIPAYGEVKIWIRFDTLPKKYDLNGKTVFHCHFLPHEDTGMITSWRLHDGK
ncbi:hypothetical protein CHLNCDRAFT_142543 [Chlorella variabilis]|uniref:Plastocyanin-like domain-containing protein n=1 Tax=Chlorella variabilis TaxID=554065 RepID=E1ZTU9_CHLVA|nr:hypothetical protein CHLNCDRAFT_142543 [Chlorella variabilis]EFN50741.1 hypothetical protein CHLNCDRAFT_142543 [Chlorella variabilis]|eukprot:XP_005842853.1 hypothetical protein CHLNCDRAFT_142543 [Chlorella variabilis]